MLHATEATKGSPKEFFAFAREREATRLRKESGAAPPWTDDLVLRDWRFCNIFREDDKTTKWFRENVRDPLRDDKLAVTEATFIFRMFNVIHVGEILLKAKQFTEWDHRKVRKLLHDVRPVTTGAYMTKTYEGVNKLEGCIATIEDARANVVADIANLENPTLKQVHTEFQRVRYIGSFMAYELVTDLRHTALLDKAPDINTWAATGPGAARGLDWVFGGPTVPRGYGKPKWEAADLAEMMVLLEMSRDPANWPREWKAWELREVEHTLCEYDKWKRGCNGEKLKRTYAGRLNPGGGYDRLRRERKRRAKSGLHGAGEGTHDA